MSTGKTPLQHLHTYLCLGTLFHTVYGKRDGHKISHNKRHLDIVDILNIASIWPDGHMTL